MDTYLRPKNERKKPKKTIPLRFTQVKSSAELLKQYNIKRERIMAENEKVSLQAQALKDPTSKQPITIVEDAFEEQVRTLKKTKKAQPTALFQECTHNGNGTMFEVEKNSKTRNQRTAEPDTMDQNDINSDDDGENTSEMSATSNKKGMSLDMYFKVHGINLEDEEDEEDEKNELDDNANDAGSGGQTSNEGTIKKKTRGKTTCKKLHATDFNDRWEVEFFQGQPVGPTNEVVSDLNQLLKQTCPHRMGFTNFGIVRM